MLAGVHSLHGEEPEGREDMSDNSARPASPPLSPMTRSSSHRAAPPGHVSIQLPSETPPLLGARTPPSATRGADSVGHQLLDAMEMRANEHKCALLYNIWTYAFNPNGRFRITWDSFMLVLVSGPPRGTGALQVASRPHRGRTVDHRWSTHASRCRTRQPSCLRGYYFWTRQA
jgi:hypothetical protein